MSSSNGNIFRVTGHLCGEFTGPGEFPTQRIVTWSYDVFFDLRLNKRLSKQSWGRWFETLSHPLWRHRNGIYIIFCKWILVLPVSTILFTMTGKTQRNFLLEKFLPLEKTYLSSLLLLGNISDTFYINHSFGVCVYYANAFIRMWHVVAEYKFHCNVDKMSFTKH